MVKVVLILAFCFVFYSVTAQTVEYITTVPLAAQCPTDSKWDDLLPALKMIKNTPSLKKERLLNVVKIIKFLLSDETEKDQCDKILEEIKEADESQAAAMIDIDSIVEERLQTIDEAIENCIPDNAELQNDTPKNNTADFSKILAKISTALAKLKENNDNQDATSPNALMPIFRSEKPACRKDLSPPLFDNLGQTGKLQSKKAKLNSISGKTKFDIPCQRAADILSETSSLPIPRGSYCDLPKNINLNAILKNPKLNPDNLPFQIVPNSISCVESDDSLAILFKPKKISLMQVYGNLLKKITITVLVPYHVSKMGV